MMDVMPTHNARFRKGFLLLLVAAVTVVFVWMLQTFLLTILMAALLSGLVHPVYTRLVKQFGGRRQAASAVTLLGVILLVVVPLLGLFGIVLNQAIRVTENIRPVVERLVNEPTYFDQQLQRIPGIDRIHPYRDQIVTRAGDVVNTVGAFLIASLSETTRMTVAFVFHAAILLYSMFFLLIDGPAMLSSIFRYLPLRPEDEQQMKDRFVSVTRATIKGTVVIGIVQGGLSGVAFWLVGIPNVMFWTIVMVVLSVLPLVGGALVWVPACLILAATGQVWQAAILAAFCALIVGSVDNVLRPWLVGRDTKMHDLVILFSTLGGLIVFGPLGFIIGPLVAGLFVTIWEIFGATYHDELDDGPSVIVHVPATEVLADTPVEPQISSAEIP